ncbi:MAG: methyltransferase domain-containing protein [Ignavibacteria bacterium]|nr:methyltransferase domain-containing protein [Ignavibacteria bacterium]
MEKVYWEEKYIGNNAAWDLGSISEPIKKYCDGLENKDLRILIPGSGNAHEAEYLSKKGFKNVYVMDISENAIKSFRRRCPDFPSDKILNEDFFLHDGTYDLILEQTFFCAIKRQRRSEYAKKVFDLLNENGVLAGLLFNHEFGNEEPPFGGTKEEYEKYFSPFFNFEIFEIAYNSIMPRADREFFIKFRKKHI